MPDTNTDIRETLNDFFRAVESMELDRVATFFDEDAQMFSPLGTYPARRDGRAVQGDHRRNQADARAAEDRSATIGRARVRRPRTGDVSPEPARRPAPPPQLPAPPNRGPLAARAPPRL